MGIKTFSKVCSGTKGPFPIIAAEVAITGSLDAT